MTDGIDPKEVLDLLADEYVRSILEALGGRDRTAPDVAERCGCSRATVYRRLNALVAAGVVAREPGVDPDGHHRARYRARPVRLSVSVDGDGLDGEVRRRRERSAEGHHLDRRDHSPPPGSVAD